MPAPDTCSEVPWATHLVLVAERQQHLLLRRPAAHEHLAPRQMQQLRDRGCEVAGTARSVVGQEVGPRRHHLEALEATRRHEALCRMLMVSPCFARHCQRNVCNKATVSGAGQVALPTGGYRSYT